jgi:hypothetical protein
MAKHCPHDIVVVDNDAVGVCKRCGSMVELDHIVFENGRKFYFVKRAADEVCVA